MQSISNRAGVAKRDNAIKMEGSPSLGRPVIMTKELIMWYNCIVKAAHAFQKYNWGDATFEANKIRIRSAWVHPCD